MATDLINSTAEDADGSYVQEESIMQVSEVASTRDKALHDVGHWLGELRERLKGGREIDICEATRMLTFYLRHFTLASIVLSRRKADPSIKTESMKGIGGAVELLLEAREAVADEGRKQRITRRLDLLQELQSGRIRPIE